MKIKNRQQLLAILAISGIALLGLDKLVIDPLTKSWKARTDRIIELKKNISQGAVLLDREQIIHNRWESMRTNSLPNNTSAAENLMFRAFDRWTQASRITMAGIKPQWKRSDENYMTYECRADAIGDMASITRFLFELEKDPMALKVESVEISSRDNNGRQLSLGVQVSGLLLNPLAE